MVLRHCLWGPWFLECPRHRTGVPRRSPCNVNNIRTTPDQLNNVPKTAYILTAGSTHVAYIMRVKIREERKSPLN